MVSSSAIFLFQTVGGRVLFLRHIFIWQTLLCDEGCLESGPKDIVRMKEVDDLLLLLEP